MQGRVEGYAPPESDLGHQGAVRATFPYDRSTLRLDGLIFRKRKRVADAAWVHHRHG